MYITNRVPCAAWPDKTPHEVCFGKRPDLSNLCVFGARGYAHVDKSKRSKLDDKAFPCMFVGYSTTTKGIRVIDLNTHRVKVVRSARFQELNRQDYIQVGDVVSRSQVRVVVCDHDDKDHDDAPQASNDQDVEMEEPSGGEPSLNDEATDMEIEGQEPETSIVPSERPQQGRMNCTDVVPRGRFDPEDEVF